jgi:hypothetical protein
VTHQERAPFLLLLLHSSSVAEPKQNGLNERDVTCTGDRSPLWWKEGKIRCRGGGGLKKKRCRELGSRRDEHAGHEDVPVVEGGAGRARGVHGGFLGFLVDQDLLVPAIGAAECLLAPATAKQKCSVSLFLVMLRTSSKQDFGSSMLDAENKQDFGSSNKPRTIANKQQSNLSHRISNAQRWSDQCNN